MTVESGSVGKLAGTQTVGSVMVVGGGIAGIQASLDLADQGFMVYLVEKETAIGGKMAQLDKTFPTNDCAMCSISPKLVDAGRHLNIKILTSTEVQNITGEAGDFKIDLIHKPRYIDESKCIGCGDCAVVCPVSLSDPYEEGLKERKAAYRLYTQAVPTSYAIDKLGTAPCRDACPASQRAQGYIALIAQGRYRDAYRVIKEDNPFPSVCGRTCHHPCEGHCTRALVDDTVSIMALKRFVMDHALAYGREPVEAIPRTQPEWVAVVGSGPAGLTAAHDLAKMGYGVTVYEALPVAGGMMRVGIPAHRLPKGVLQQDIDDILALGVVLKTNSPIKDPSRLLEEGYSAVCLATGIARRDHSLGIEGDDAEGVVSAATFLRKINLGETMSIGSRVAVVGGGITALDATAVARRLGAEEVYLVLDRPRGELPAYHWEVSAVESEGIHLIENSTAVRIITEGGVVCGVELAETGKGMTVDDQGRRKPKIKDGTEYSLEIDTVIGTVGQYSDLIYLDPQFDELSGDKDTLATEIPGLFVVGGRKTGASYIINAVALGHQVANSIQRYLHGKPLDTAKKTAAPVVKFDREELAQKVLRGEIQLQPKIEPQFLPVEERVTSFREVVLGLTEHQARKEAQRCLQCGICSECLMCEYACGVDAVDHNMLVQEHQVNVGAVILAPGYQIYNAALSAEFGYGRYPNVITALQFERLLSASGPTGGHIKRPSDGQVPAKIAFLQCVGSRDQEHDYCSSVCCMYATKEAIMAKEHHPDIDIHVFMMDMRAFSKGYWSYYERARDQYGVQYTRCRISKVHKDPDSGDLLLEYQDDAGDRHLGKFDMVVLSVGMEISTAVKQLGERIGVELDEYGFCHTIGFDPLETSIAGVYAIGPFKEPKDIPESVIEASGAVASCAALLNDARWTLSKTRTYPPERDVSEQAARIGVFVCHCGSNIAGYLDVQAVVGYSQTLANVTHAESNLYSCSQDSIERITEIVKEKELNRVVVASCSPLTHGPLFSDSIRAAGLNPYLFEMANIRNQCSWVHSDNWEVATGKAIDLVRMAVARAALLSPQTTIEVPVEPVALIVGGGVAGMTSALSLADQGITTHLIERKDKLGGNLRDVFIPLPVRGGDDPINPQQTLSELIDKLDQSDDIHVHLQSNVMNTRGFMGDFVSTIEDATGATQEIAHGATLLATGGREYRGDEFGYGSNDKVLTQQEFEAQMVSDESLPESIVMIQCVGPAEEFCSRICCTVAMKNALAFLDKVPDGHVTVLYKDIRTYGFKESLYTEARERGVLFIRYDNEHLPNIHDEETLSIEVWDPVLRRSIHLNPDLLILSMPVIPPEDVKQIAALFKVSVDNDGYFLEAHVKLRPVDFATDGVFMAGMAHYPKLLEETIIQAKAAATRAARVLTRDSIIAGGRVAVIDPLACTGCLTCVRICPFNVPQMMPDLLGVGGISGVAQIEAAVCQGCGLCSAECPARAIQLMHYTDAQMSAKVRALIQDPGEQWRSTSAFTVPSDETLLMGGN